QFSQPLGKMRPVQRRRPTLRAVNFERFETTPRAVGPVGQVGNDHMGMELRIGRIAPFSAGPRWTGGQMIKAHRREVANGDPLLPGPTACLRISLKLTERPRDGLAVGCD